MGGLGSGRFHQAGKTVTDQLASLDVRMLQRDGLLVAGMTTTLNWSQSGRLLASMALYAEADRVLLSVNTPESNEAQHQWVYLDQTPCNLGGSRAWFRCPCCSRRVALMYGRSQFACRHCLQLAYASQRETADKRALRKVDRLRSKLHWGPGVMSIDRSKPKGMHDQTYARLTTEHDGLVRQYLTGVTERNEWLQGYVG